MAMIMTIASAALSVVGGIAQANAASAAGEAARQAADFKAKQLEAKGQEERAAAQRKVGEERQKTVLTQSTLQARAAASGAGATDDSVIKLESDIGGRGEYQALAEMYNGENRARGLEMQAASARYDGEMEKMGAEAKATAALIGGIGGGFSKFASASPFSLPTGA